jgi:hypothetical protein
MATKLKNVALAAHVSPAANVVTAKEMAGFVSDHSGKLRLVPHSGEEAGEDHHEASWAP